MIMEIESILKIIDSMDNMDDNILLDNGNDLYDKNIDLIDRIINDEIIL
jgi:hypothetical protein